MGVCLIAGAKDKAIQDFILDEQTVYAIPVSGLPRHDHQFSRPDFGD